MQVLLKRSNSRQDLQCTICGQTFRLYWERPSPQERATMRAIVAGELRDHHSPEQGGDRTPSAHPDDHFALPNWSGAPQFVVGASAPDTMPVIGRAISQAAQG